MPPAPLLLSWERDKGRAALVPLRTPFPMRTPAPRCRRSIVGARCTARAAGRAGCTRSGPGGHRRRIAEPRAALVYPGGRPGVAASGSKAALGYPLLARGPGRIGRRRPGRRSRQPGSGRDRGVAQDRGGMRAAGAASAPRPRPPHAPPPGVGPPAGPGCPGPGRGAPRLGSAVEVAAGAEGVLGRRGPLALGELAPLVLARRSRGRSWGGPRPAARHSGSRCAAACWRAAAGSGPP